MIVTDSRTRDAVRPVFLTFDDDGGRRQRHGARRAGRRRGRGAHGPRRRRRASPSSRRTRSRISPSRPVTVAATAAAAAATIARGCWSPPMASARSSAALAGIATVGHDYGQSGHRRDRRARKAARRPGGGAFPAGRSVRDRCRSSGNRSSLVWTEPTEVAERLVGGDALVFQVELERRFGHRLGAITVVDKPSAFPLGAHAGARIRQAALCACRRRGAFDPPDRRAGAQPRLSRCRGAGRDDRRGAPPRPRHRVADGARPLPALAALRHDGDGAGHRRAEPALRQRQPGASHRRATSGSAWSTGCRA